MIEQNPENVQNTEPSTENHNQLSNSQFSINSEIEIFIEQIDSLATTFPLTESLISSVLMDAYQKYQRFVNDYCSVRSDNITGEEIHDVGPDYISKYNQLTKDVNSADHSMKIVPKSLLVSLISQFDSFLGRLIRTLFYIKPEFLNASEKPLTFSQLIEFASIDKAKEYIVEKEIETVLRKSHSEQFDWLETKFKIELKKNLPIWSMFIEITERRNIIVHTNGIVSSQYIKNCRDHGVDLEENIKPGTELGVSSEYFINAYECIYEIGFKLAQVLWRKLQPSQIGLADKSLNDITFILLGEEKNRLALKLLDFAAETLKRHSDETQRRIIIINRAQAYKWTGDNQKALQIVNNEDWTAIGNEFKLAVAVIKDDFETAASFIKRIDPESILKKTSYEEWPLFKRFRNSEPFLKAYKEFYGADFTITILKEEAHGLLTNLLPTF